jgi:plastocyanin
LSSKYKNNDSKKDDNRRQHNCHNCSRGPQQRDTISIVSGGASKTTDAFQQNPAEVSVGATATWTSDDSQPHTVTSGQTPPTPNGGFDSCILAPAARFEHTFTDAGEYLYFFVLYPNMVGSVGIR